MLINIIKNICSQPTSRQFLIYSSVGVLGTIAHYTVLVIFVHTLGIRPIIGSTAGFIVGGLVNYYLNYKLTFSSSKQHRTAMIQFFLVAVFGLGINILVMWVGTELFDYFYFYVQLLATFIVLVVNFFINKMWTFND